MEMIDIVKKLIGPIQPVGESNEDRKRLENLNEFITLADEMIIKLKDVAENSDSHEHSVALAGDTAKKFLNELKKEL
jgi:hypothetical protein